MREFLTYILIVLSVPSAWAQNDIIVTATLTPAPAVDPYCPASFDSIWNDITGIMGNCDQEASNLRNEGVTPRQSREAAIHVCECYASERTIWGTAVQSLEGESGGEQSLRSLVSQFQNGQLSQSASAPNRNEVNDNIATESYILRDLRNGILTQASLLATNDQEMIALSSAFNQSWMRGDSEIRSLNNTIRSRFDSLPQRTPSVSRVNLQVPEINQDELSGLTPPNSCVSHRDYQAWRQFPEDNGFYMDLASNASYSEEEWNYDSLRRQVRNLPYFNRQEAMDDPRAAALIRRLDFLHRNPLIKNAFMDTTGETIEVRRRLYGLIRQNLTPSEPCTEGRSCQSLVFRNAEKYRNALSEFFQSPSAREILVGSIGGSGKREFENRIRNDRSADRSYGPPIVDRIFTAEHTVSVDDIMRTIPPSSMENTFASQAILTAAGSGGGTSLSTPGQLFMDASDLGAATLSTSQILRPPQSVFNTAAFSRDLYREQRLRGIVEICPKIITSYGARPFLMNALERDWAKEMSDEIRQDGVLSFGEFQRSVCTNRSNERGEVGDFTSFMSQRCGSGAVPNCDLDAVRVEFNNAYPRVGSYESGVAAAFVDFRRTTRYSSVQRNIAEALARTRTNSYADYRREAVANISGTGELSRRFSSGVSGGAATQTATRTLASSRFERASAVPPGTNSPAVGDQVVGPAVFQPQGQQSGAPRAETIRSQVQQGELASQGIRDEISSLRNVLERESRSGATAESPLVTGLNERLAALERRLSAQDSENANLRRQLQEAEQQVARPSPGASPQESAPRAAGTTFSGGANAGVQPQGSPGQLAGVPTGNPSTTSNSETRLSPQPARSSGGTVNGALLASRAQSGVSAQGSGSITVTQTSNADYLRLLSQTVGNEISESLPPEIFDSIAISETSLVERYRDRINALPGEVVRLEIREQGTNEQVEILVVKSENGISIASRSGRGIASEPETRAPERLHTRDALLHELEGSR